MPSPSWPWVLRGKAGQDIRLFGSGAYLPLGIIYPRA